MTGQHPSLPFPATNAMPPETIHTGANVCSLGYEARFLPATYPRLPELYGAGYPEHIAYLNGLTSSHPVLYSGALVSKLFYICSMMLDFKIQNEVYIVMLACKQIDYLSSYYLFVFLTKFNLLFYILSFLFFKM